MMRECRNIFSVTVKHLEFSSNRIIAKKVLPFRAVPINWSSIARICSEADMVSISVRRNLNPRTPEGPNDSDSYFVVTTLELRVGERQTYKKYSTYIKNCTWRYCINVAKK